MYKSYKYEIPYSITKDMKQSLNIMSTTFVHTWNGVEQLAEQVVGYTISNILNLKFIILV